MKKSIVFFLLCLTAFACHNSADILVDSSDITVSFFLITSFGEDSETKTSYENTSGGFIFKWAAGDVVGIVSPEGGQLKFPIMEKDYGKTFADFDGRGFALNPNTRYASYFPFIADYDLNPSAVPISYEGQVSVGDDDISHLGKYAFWVAQGVSPSEGKLVFSFLNIGSPHRYRMPALSGDYSSLTLSVSDDKYILSGTVNLLAVEEENLITISPTSLSPSIVLDLTGTTLDSDGPLRCWMMLPPANLSGDVIHMKLMLKDGTSLLASVRGADYPANYRKVFNALTSVYPAEIKAKSDGGTVEIKLMRSSPSDEVSVSIEADWLTESSSSTSDLVTTYTIAVAENTGAAREGTVLFTEVSTGLSNTVTISQSKAGTIIGIGSWGVDNHSGTAN